MGQFIRPDVATFCVGHAASVATLLLAAGAKGKRSCLPHARIMLRQPGGQAQGQATDLEIHKAELVRARESLNELFAELCGKTKEQVAKDTDRDKFMSAQEAVEYGLVDD